MKRRSLLIGTGGVLLLAGAGSVAWASSVGSMGEYAERMRRIRARLAGPPDLKDLVRQATLAANSHNTQPWRFRIRSDAIDLLPDFSRRTPAVDPDDHHLFVSLGCAAANLAIAAQAAGRPGELEIEPAGDTGATFAFSVGPERPTPLSAAIAERQSTRAEYDGRPVPAADLAALERAAGVPGVRLLMLTERSRIGRLRDLVVAGNAAQMADPAFLRELKQWLRFNPRSAAAAGDGLFAACSGNPTLPTFLGGIAFDLLFRAKAENDKYARHIDSSAGIAVFVGDHADREHWIKAGVACQRFALTATSLGLRHAFINQPVEVARFRPELAGLIGEPDRRPDIVLRFGYGPMLPFSPRRPVDAVLA